MSDDDDIDPRDNNPDGDKGGKALRLYSQIAEYEDKIHAIYRRRIPHARMERGKADKRGDHEKALYWGDEIMRLYRLVSEHAARQMKIREQLAALGYPPVFPAKEYDSEAAR